MTNRRHSRVTQNAVKLVRSLPTAWKVVAAVAGILLSIWTGVNFIVEVALDRREQRIQHVSTAEFEKYREERRKAGQQLREKVDSIENRVITLEAKATR